MSYTSTETRGIYDTQNQLTPGKPCAEARQTNATELILSVSSHAVEHWTLPATEQSVQQQALFPAARHIVDAAAVCADSMWHTRAIWWMTWKASDCCVEPRLVQTSDVIILQCLGQHTSDAKTSAVCLEQNIALPGSTGCISANNHILQNFCILMSLPVHYDNPLLPICKFFKLIADSILQQYYL